MPRYGSLFRRLSTVADHRVPACNHSTFDTCTVQVLLLDEVTTFVDAEDQQRVMETVRRYLSAVSATRWAQNDAGTRCCCVAVSAGT